MGSKILECRTDVDGYSGLPACYAVSIGEYLPTFRTNAAPPSSDLISPLMNGDLRVKRSFGTSVNIYQSICHNTPEDVTTPNTLILDA